MKELDWWEDYEWWSSKGIKDIVEKPSSEEDKKVTSARETFTDGLKKIFGKEQKLQPVGAGGGSVGGSGNGGSSINVGVGTGHVVSPMGVAGGVSNKSMTFDDKAKVEILKVKQTLLRHLTLQHIPSNAVIAGGCFVSFFHDEEPKDIDVFVLGSDENDLITLPNMEKPGKYTTVKDFQNYTGRSDILAIFNDTESKFQYIYTKVKTPRELLEAFDFTHCCCSYYDDKMWINPRIYDAIKNKWLIPNIDVKNIKPERFQRFQARGFKDPGNLTNFYGET